jgi:osmotically-inducible protein OsmY
VRAPGVAQSVAQTRVARSLATPRFQSIGVSVSDSGATITGTARSAEDRRMAELLLRLEPGINQVNNQIIVAP